MASNLPAVKNVAHTFEIMLPSQSNPKIFQANPTIAAGDFKIFVGSAFANMTNLPTLKEAGERAVVISLEQSEMNQDKIIWYAHDAAGDEWCDVYGTIETVAQKIDDLASQSSVDTVDTVVDAIKAKTDNLPASPAAVGSEMDLVNSPNATALAAIGTSILKLDFTGITGEAERSLLNGLRFLRNKWTLISGTLTVYKENDSTVAWTAAMTQSASSEPVTGSDPA